MIFTQFYPWVKPTLLPTFTQFYPTGFTQWVKPTMPTLTRIDVRYLHLESKIGSQGNEVRSRVHVDLSKHFQSPYTLYIAFQMHLKAFSDLLDFGFPVNKNTAAPKTYEPLHLSPMTANFGHLYKPSMALVHGTTRI